LDGEVRALDRKLAAIGQRTDTPDDFIIADAKDADMAFGLAAPGPVVGIGEGGPDTGASGGTRYRTRTEYLADMADLVRAGALDVLLTSASNGERLACDGVLDGSEVTLAVRANDSTDIWFARGSAYAAVPSRPFRTAELTLVRDFCDLVLYSVTFNNDLDHDRATLEAFAQFRRDARAVDMRYFLEVFNPNAARGLDPATVGAFVNDSIIRSLAGVTAAERPLFLKMAYNGPRALEELVAHDPSIVVGILGGSAGTTRDTYELLAQAYRHGARVALFGRKIQRAESQRDLVRLMRPVLRGELSPSDAVGEYHGALRRHGIAPARTLAEDQVLTEAVLRG
jgi:DhnA family fructose-bisphosphate aldolase class Ia